MIIELLWPSFFSLGFASPSFCYNEKGNESFIIITSFFSILLQQRGKKRQLSSPSLIILLKKMATVTTIAFWWFSYKEGDDNNVNAFFYGGGGVKKEMAGGGLLFFWSFSFSSLKLTINHEMMVFFMLKVLMARGRRLKKGGGDVEVQSKMLFHHNRHLPKKMLLHQNKQLLSKMLFIATPLWANVRMRLTLPKMGTWSPSGLSQFQSSIIEGKNTLPWSVSLYHWKGLEV